MPERPVDLTAALDWASSEVGSPVVSSEPLEGGLTSTMLALRHADDSESVLRLMTNEPWRTHGADLTARERDAQLVLADTDVPAPVTLGLDTVGAAAGVATHVMSRLRGARPTAVDDGTLEAMADVLTTIHAVRPPQPFRAFQSWAWQAKWVVPEWSRHPESWRRAFDVLDGPAPSYEPTFLHRDFGHHNLLWSDGAISGVVDWVETSTGPAWLDAAHAASNLAVAYDVERALAFLEAYADAAGARGDAYWLVMDVVGFLPPPGRPPMFGRPEQLERLDDWLHEVVAQAG
ncbi:hypothetical protein CFI00_07170 [Nocardioides sp. S5]|uniref:phosphotransferase family protein n=1 Tax=Nocardioides sp. S5 TaxID=2017486 RepID=UPI001A8CAA06|nr:aminoglycoside phosphotransferase family protein [Nocardioides sp. S5]QSR30286.1 hypothetical protein CFI00_07170 [Nocardioides sp. S5]